MKVRPLTGQVLIEILPLDTRTAGGIELPQRSLSPEEVQERHANPEKPKGIFARVIRVGAWPKIKCGLALLPEFRSGQTVIVSAFRGQDMTENGRKLKILSQSDVLAVVSP